MLRRKQRRFPFGAGVVVINTDGVGNLEVTMRWAMEAGCIGGTSKLLCWGFADRAKEGHVPIGFVCDGLCQSRMGLNPLNGIFLGRKLPNIVRLAIRPRYPNAPNAALFHRRQLRTHVSHRRNYDPFGECGQVAAKLLGQDEACRIAANIAKLPEPLRSSVRRSAEHLDLPGP
jgi:hypothetical protein